MSEDARFVTAGTEVRVPLFLLNVTANWPVNMTHIQQADADKGEALENVATVIAVFASQPDNNEDSYYANLTSYIHAGTVYDCAGKPKADVLAYEAMLGIVFLSRPFVHGVKVAASVVVVQLAMQYPPPSECVNRRLGYELPSWCSAVIDGMNNTDVPALQRRVNVYNWKRLLYIYVFNSEPTRPLQSSIVSLALLVPSLPRALADVCKTQVKKVCDIEKYNVADVSGPFVPFYDACTVVDTWEDLKSTAPHSVQNAIIIAGLKPGHAAVQSIKSYYKGLAQYYDVRNNRMYAPKDGMAFTVRLWSVIEYLMSFVILYDGVTRLAKRKVVLVILDDMFADSRIQSAVVTDVLAHCATRRTRLFATAMRHGVPSSIFRALQANTTVKEMQDAYVLAGSRLNTEVIEDVYNWHKSTGLSNVAENTRGVAMYGLFWKGYSRTLTELLRTRYVVVVPLRDFDVGSAETLLSNGGVSLNVFDAATMLHTYRTDFANEIDEFATSPTFNFVSNNQALLIAKTISYGETSSGSKNLSYVSRVARTLRAMLNAAVVPILQRIQEIRPAEDVLNYSMQIDPILIVPANHTPITLTLTGASHFKPTDIVVYGWLNLDPKPQRFRIRETVTTLQPGAVMLFMSADLKNDVFMNVDCVRYVSARMFCSWRLTESNTALQGRTTSDFEFKQRQNGMSLEDIALFIPRVLPPTHRYFPV